MYPYDVDEDGAPDNEEGFFSANTNNEWQRHELLHQTGAETVEVDSPSEAEDATKRSKIPRETEVRLKGSLRDMLDGRRI